MRRVQLESVKVKNSFVQIFLHSRASHKFFANLFNCFGINRTEHNIKKFSGIQHFTTLFVVIRFFSVEQNKKNLGLHLQV